jgi:hypothetical protein
MLYPPLATGELREKLSFQTSEMAYVYPIPPPHITPQAVGVVVLVKVCEQADALSVRAGVTLMFILTSLALLVFTRISAEDLDEEAAEMPHP